MIKKTALLFLCLFATRAFAESVALSSGEVLDGKLLDFPREVTIQLPDGTKKTFPYEKITSIYKENAPESFSPFLSQDKNKKPLGENPKSDSTFPELNEDRGPYASPLQTFETWKNAALRDDIDGMADCYVSYRKGEVKKDLKKLSKKTRENMKKAMIETIFTPTEPYFQGELAIMEVSWTKGLASQTQTLKFSLENNKEWKILE